MSGSLAGKYIVNTRASHQAAELDDLIRERGAFPLEYPCIAVQPPQDSALLDAAIHKLWHGEFDWLVLTSANAVWSIANRLRSLELSLNYAPFKTAVVGTGTAEVVRSELGIDVDLLPVTFVAEHLAEAVLQQGGGSVFLPESRIARSSLADTLTSGGATVHRVVAYDTVCANDDHYLLADLQSSRVDIITFTSSSTVTCFANRLRQEDPQVNIQALLSDICIACIGTKTAATATEIGFPVSVVPREFTLQGLLSALEDHFKQQ